MSRIPLDEHKTFYTDFRPQFTACFTFRDDYELKSDKWFNEVFDAYTMYKSDFKDIETIQQFCCWMYKDYTLRDHGFQLREELKTKIKP